MNNMNNKTTTVEPTPAIDPAFLQLMKQHRGGDCLDDLGKALREANIATQLTGKASSVTLKIKISPTSAVKGAVAVSDDIKVTLPKEDKGGSLFYADENGTLLRDDPKQATLELKVVTGGPKDGETELRRVEV